LARRLLADSWLELVEIGLLALEKIWLLVLAVLLAVLENTFEELVVLVLCTCWLEMLLALELLIVCTVDERWDCTTDLLDELLPLLNFGVSSMDCCSLTESELILALPWPSS